MISLRHLPLDVCDRVLTALPDYLSLRFAVLASKQLYEAYAVRKRSITCAVAYNEVGPSLSFALALVRTQAVISGVRLEEIVDGLNNSDPESAYWNVDVTSQEALELSRVSVAVRRLEVLFSNRFKDRTASCSTLTDSESHRFRRALYRAWIISVLSNDRHGDSKHSDVDLTFLKFLTENEFVELYEVMSFLDMLVTRHYGIRMTPYHMRPLEVEPDDLLASFDFSYPIDDMSYTLPENPVVSSSYSALCKEKDVVTVFKNKFGSQSILTQPRVEEIQACQHCGNQSDLLFGQNNWHWLPTIWTAHEMTTLLPGKLPYNLGVRASVFARFDKFDNYVAMVSEMFSSQNDSGSEWEGCKWLCLDCLSGFVQSRMFSWYIKQLVQDGHVFKTNCWYGWNCRTQVHNLAHADKLNHLCEPTDRDDSSAGHA